MLQISSFENPNLQKKGTPLFRLGKLFKLKIGWLGKDFKLLRTIYTPEAASLPLESFNFVYLILGERVPDQCSIFKWPSFPSSLDLFEGQCDLGSF